jgi:hypothetical protein
MFGGCSEAELAAADLSSLQSIGGTLRTYTNGINVCAASTVSNALGHTTLHNVCEGTESQSVVLVNASSCSGIRWTGLSTGYPQHITFF